MNTATKQHTAPYDCSFVDITIQDMGLYIEVKCVCKECGKTKYEEKLYKNSESTTVNSRGQSHNVKVVE